MLFGNRWNVSARLAFANFADWRKDTGGHCLHTNLYMPRAHALMRPPVHLWYLGTLGPLPIH